MNPPTDPQILRDLIDQTTKKVNELNKDLINIYSLRYKFLIHDLVRNAAVKVADIEKATGMSFQNIYNIVDEVDKLLKDK